MADYTSALLVSNIHCPSCVTHAQDVLREIPDIQLPIHVSLIDHTIRVKHEHDKTQEDIVNELIKAAFEVQHVTTIGPNGVQTHDYDVLPKPTTVSSSRSTWLMSRAQRKHIENCKACQSKRERTPKRSWATLIRQRRLLRSKTDDTAKSDDTLVNDQPAVINIDGAADDGHNGLYVATVAIGGMTCSSCSSTITKELNGLDFVETVDVSLMTNNARVVFLGTKADSDKLVEAIEDLGYEATVNDVLPLKQTKPSPEDESDEYKATLSIGGMTCGSCVGTITRGVQELPFVSSVNVDLVGNRGDIVFRDRQKLDAILEKIDDLGYDATVVEVESVGNPARSKALERTVQVRIDGMYCEHCPENVVAALQDRLPSNAVEGGHAYSITQTPTFKDPLITIVYRPSPPEFTVRNFISVIDACEEAFKASVYHPPTLEERSRRMQRKEQTDILMRLVFTAVVAIPTLIIGVVYMSLVPSSNPTRQWWQQPVLAGNAMREEWALFFMTTPVMIFGTDIFHTRALKEIKSLWRRKSKVPILRRFYRFGSMNLLISAGAAVAYFSSLAVLIMDATSPRNMSQSRSSDTYFDTVTFLTFFILIGRFLEAYSKAKTGDAVAMLSKLRPSEALLVEDVVSGETAGRATIQMVPVDQLEVGDSVQIPHGTSPPTDGFIEQQGTFLFDESSLTGESKPVKKVCGDEVYTGSVNVSDPVRIKVTEVGGTSMLDQIVNVVREGQAKRAPIERIADILTGYFVPIITLIAIITWLIWLGLGESGKLPRAWLDVSKGGWAFWSLEFAIAVFVVACPCGIGLAAPTALFVGGGLAAKHGILVQGGGEAFQEASKLDAIVFDKTGTLTEGQMKVTDFEVLHQHEQDVLNIDQKILLAASRLMEESSTHPIARAIAEFCAQQSEVLDIRSEDIKEVPGQGMTGQFTVSKDLGSARYEAALGNERLLGSIGLGETSSSRISTKSEKEHDTVATKDYYLDQILQKHQSLGHSTAIFAIRNVTADSSAAFIPAAVFAIADPIRTEAPGVLQALRESNLEIHMCTGDNQTTALAIASQLGIQVSNVRAGVLPQDKAAYIQELQGLSGPDSGNSRQSRRIIAFVGDGTNDTPALSAADVSIALSSGSDVAITTASFILLNSDLNTILSLVRLAKRVFLRVKLNFAWAAVYNVCLVPVAAGVFFPLGASHDHGGWRLGPVWASVAMAASSVSVVTSSLALKLPEIRWRK
ncbi:Cu2+-exporting ATPase [Exophiala viscosa]|uniref:Cu2+-exporting ATPase n=1 Tax=Exophiala viscosa TaxID=2486360 RepID=UPI002194CBEA|nr:Cu2+-exporting ATPase [Exophiala viscosa]